MTSTRLRYVVRCWDQNSKVFVGRDGLSHMSLEKAPRMTRKQAETAKRLHDEDAGIPCAEIVSEKELVAAASGKS